ncbi:MAG: hypothetical protein WCH39_19080, partial [Schlesneria sp.]
MSDFLANLATRVLNPTNVLQPRPVSRFEPVASPLKSMPVERIWTGPSLQNLERGIDQSEGLENDIPIETSPQDVGQWSSQGLPPNPSLERAPSVDASSREVAASKEVHQIRFDRESDLTASDSPRSGLSSERFGLEMQSLTEEIRSLSQRFSNQSPQADHNLELKPQAQFNVNPFPVASQPIPSIQSSQPNEISAGRTIVVEDSADQRIQSSIRPLTSPALTPMTGSMNLFKEGAAPLLPVASPSKETSRMEAQSSGRKAEPDSSESGLHSREDLGESNRQRSGHDNAPDAASILAGIQRLTNMEKSAMVSAPAPSSSAQSFSNEDRSSERSAAGPTVQIRIGRIEVKASSKASKPLGPARALQPA